MLVHKISCINLKTSAKVKKPDKARKAYIIQSHLYQVLEKIKVTFSSKTNIYHLQKQKISHKQREGVDVKLVEKVLGLVIMLYIFKDLNHSTFFSKSYMYI